MVNVLLDPLPDEWNGYEINTDFRIGIQLLQLAFDTDLSDSEKFGMSAALLFERENGVMRNHPDNINACLDWFLNGWFTDHPSESTDKRRLVDYDADQWRIYADFRQIYGIDLSEVSYMHWWEFCGLLWNMPAKQSAFMRVIGIRQQDLRTRMSKEERKYYTDAQKMYEIEQPEEKKEYSPEEKNKIDEYDRMMAAIKAKGG